MQRSLYFWSTLFCSLALARALAGDPTGHTYVGLVQTDNGGPVAHVNVGIHNFGNTTTTDNGDFKLLDPTSQLKVGYLYIFYVEDWVVTDPYVHERGQTYLPDPGAGSISLRVLPRGDRRLLSGTSIQQMLTEKTSHIQPKPKSGEVPPEVPNPPRVPISDRLLSPLAIYAETDRLDDAARFSNSVQLISWFEHPYRLGSANLAPQQAESSLSQNPEKLPSTDSFLFEQSRATGIAAEAIASAIQAWSRSAVQPYQVGLVALNEERYSEAISYFKKSIALSPSDLDNKNTSLASAEYHHGDYAAAEDLYRKLLTSHPLDAVLMNRLAVVLLQEGKYSEAEILFKNAISAYEKGGPESEDLAIDLTNLGLVYANEGRYSEAIPLYNRALLMFEKVLGPNHHDVAVQLDRLGQLYHHDGEDSHAEEVYKHAIAIDEKVFGADSIHVATKLNSLGALYDDQHNYSEAERLYKRALRIYEQKLGPDHPFVATMKNNLGYLYSNQQKRTEAESMFREALVVQDEKTPNSPVTAATLMNLGRLYEREHRYAEAAPLLRRALEIYEKALGPENLMVADCADILASTLDGLAQESESKSLRKRAADIRSNKR
jgi:tetratricopeptide (TPR) repeat protein